MLTYLLSKKYFLCSSVPDNRAIGLVFSNPPEEEYQTMYRPMIQHKKNLIGNTVLLKKCEKLINNKV